MRFSEKTDYDKGKITPQIININLNQASLSYWTSWQLLQNQSGSYSKVRIILWLDLIVL